MKTTMQAAAVAVLGMALAAPAWGQVTVTLHYTQPTQAELEAGAAERPRLRATGRPDAAYCHSGKGCIIAISNALLGAGGELLSSGGASAVGPQWPPSYGRWVGSGRIGGSPPWEPPYSGPARDCGRFYVYLVQVKGVGVVEWGRNTKIGDVDIPCGLRSPTEPPPEPESCPVERCDHIAIVPSMPRAVSGDEDAPDHWLHVTNPGAASITFTVTGRDEAGTKGGTYRRELPAYRSVIVNMRAIEAAFDVTKPEGWWRLTATGTGPLYVGATMLQGDARRFLPVERPAVCEAAHPAD